MYSCGAGVSDYHKKLAEDLYFSSDGSRREIIIGSKSESGILIDSILILPTIESYKCNDEYIIVKQRPNKDLIIMDFAHDHLGPFFTDDELEDNLKKAEETIGKDNYYMKLFENEYNYWIIRMKDQNTLGPYNTTEFEHKIDSLGINLRF